MKIQLGAVIAVLMLSAAAATSARVTTPAWQAPGFLMEEVVVTANAEEIAAASVASVITPAWQKPGFVMEEVVVTASAEDVSMAARERLHRRARQLIVAQMRRNLA